MNSYETLSPQGKEWVLCALDPAHFIFNHVRTYDPYQGIRLFPNHAYLRHAVRSLHDHRLNIFSKGRQLTFSWLMCAYGVWDFTFHYAATCLYASKRQEDAYELKDRCDFIIEHLPDFLRPIIGENNKTTLGNLNLRSRLKFMPATENIGRTFTASHVFLDEFAHVVCDAAKMFTSIKPTINAGGSCTVFSSPNGPTGKFYDLAEQQESGWDVILKNGFRYHHMPYSVHPEHDQAWEAAAFQGLSKAEVDQEYRALWVRRGGLIYPDFDESTHVCDDFPIPPTWPVVCGLDFGGANPTAACWIAFDPSNGRGYIFAEYKQAGALIRDHAKALKQITGKRPLALGVISDHDSQHRLEYEAQGISTRAAIKDWDSGYDAVNKQLMVGQDGKPGLYVFRSCRETFREFMTYSYAETDASKRNPEEKPLKLNDHLMDTVRYCLRTTLGSRMPWKPIRTVRREDSPLGLTLTKTEEFNRGGGYGAGLTAGLRRSIPLPEGSFRPTRGPLRLPL